ncbi:MAG: urea ABC transporter substrate-binding protein, partial [Mariprofundus sp.]
MLTVLFIGGCQKSDDSPIKIGILHSLTGTMAISEKPVADAVLLAIEEINQSGGLLGRKLVPVIADGKSDWPTFASEAERLITVEKVAVVFGCWTSASRKTVKPIFEKYKSLLFYPVQYEGLEESPNIIYLGAAPNQQITPAISWAAEYLGKRLYLIGSDYVFPRVANWIIRKQAKLLALDIVGESYIPLGGTDFDKVVANIKASKPDVIINSINGSSNVAFFHAYAEAGISIQDSPVISFSIGETELAAMHNNGDMVGHYAAWSYFQNMASDGNRKFVSAFKSRFGRDRPVSDPMEVAYIGVKLWAQAFETQGSTEALAILNVIRTLSAGGPEGIVAIDFNNRHAWRQMHIGRVNRQSGFDIV